MRETRARRQTLDPELLRQQMISRRELLLAAAGASMALLVGLPRRASAAVSEEDWQTIEAVQQHLLPDEPQAPGAESIQALNYLQKQFPHLEAEQRAFLLNGVGWLEDLSQQRNGQGFVDLATDTQDQLLRQIAQSRAGENWLSTLLTYLFEALLTAPAYGGNPGGIGWRWLDYTAGFPLADFDTLYWKLPR